MKVFAFVLGLLLVGVQAASAQGILFTKSGGGVTAPSSIGFTGTTIVASAAQGTFVGTLSTVGGVGPYTYTVSNSKFQIVGNQVQRSGTGVLTAGNPESLNFTSTDSNSNSTNTATNGQGPYSVSVTSSGATILTTITFVNPSGSTTGTNFITNEAGLAFKDGDIASGCTTGAPQFVDNATSTNIPFSESVSPICWPDGSLRFASFIFRDPVAIAGSSSATINVENGGTYPSASSRSLSDFTAGGLDLNQQVTGLDSQLSGTWECDLGQGITANSTGGVVKQGYGYHYLTGPVGEVWRVQADFRQSGANHGQLECFWYVAALQDASNNLAGIRYLIRTTAPWYDVASPAQNFWSFSAWGDYNGASLITDNWSGHESAYSFTWAGSSGVCSFNGAVPTAGKCLNVSGSPNWQTGNLVRLTNTGGSLPSPLATGTSYYMANGNATPYSTPYSTTQFNISTASNVANGNLIAISANCTGTCNATAYPYITPFGSLFDANATGNWNYIQGNGSIATDSGVRVQPNPTYTRSAQVIPPLCFSCFTPNENSAFPYWGMTGGPMTRFMEATGERPDIGPINGWAATYWFNQTAIDEENIRTIGLAAGNFAINFRSSNASYYGSLPVINNGPVGGGNYTNMPPKSLTLRTASNAGTATAGYTTPQNASTVWLAGYDEMVTSHMPDWDFQTFLVTGEPEYMDMVQEWGSEALTNTATTVGTASVGSTTSIHGTSGTGRYTIVSGTEYYGTLLQSAGNLIRADAWPRRMEAEAAFLQNPENASYNTYFNDLEKATTNAANAWVNLFGGSFPWVTNNGVYYENNCSDANLGLPGSGCMDAWADGYFLSAWNYSLALIPGDTNIPTFVTYMSKWFPHVDSTFGTPYVGVYEVTMRSGNQTSTSPFFTADSSVDFQMPVAMKLAWSSSNTTFTVSGNAGGYTPTAGDTIYWNQGNSSQPGGFSLNTQYFVCNVSGNTFNLSATSSPCTALQPSDTQSGRSGWYLYSTSITGTNTYLYPPVTSDGSGYSANILGALQWSAANSISGVSTAITHLSTLVSNNLDGFYPSGYKNDPKYLYQTSY